MFKIRKNISNHQLFYFDTCPFCIKVRFALWKMGIKVKMKDNMLKPSNKAELIAGGGKKQVPCLRIEKNNEIEWLYESDAIIEYFQNASYAE